MNPIVDLAMRLAVHAHIGQCRKWTGEPYIEHPIRVAANFRNPVMRAAALLHDVVEDSSFTIDSLLNDGVPLEIASIVELLTRNPNGESHEHYIARIVSSGNPSAILVKIADVLDNLVGNREPEMIERYRWTLAELTSGKKTCSHCSGRTCRTLARRAKTVVYCRMYQRAISKGCGWAA